MPPKGKYTDPKLRDEVKEELKQSDKGGQPGQWSARKAQMMASEYKKRGGDYTTDKDQKDESQQNLTNWGEEEWQTKEGSGNAKKEDGTEKRYLPKKAWEKMSDKEKEETDKKKQQESKEGKQYVENTDKAKESRKKATKDGNGQQTQGQRQSARQKDQNAKKSESASKDESTQKDNSAAQKKGAGSQKKGAGGQKKNNKKEKEAASEEEFEDPGMDDDVSPEHEDAKNDDDGGDDDNEAENKEEQKQKPQSNAGQKRKAESKQANGSSKKQKDNAGEGKSNETIGSKHMDATEPGQQGSNDRLPKEGQQIHWKAMPGWVDGKVVEVLKKGKTVDGKSVKASASDVKLVLKSNSSGKICVHKPSACYYD